MDIPTISCPSCNANIESTNHVFFECDIATDMWKLVFRWCDIPLFQASSWDSFNDWEQSLGMLLKERNTGSMDITTSFLWWLWRYRKCALVYALNREEKMIYSIMFVSFIFRASQ
ncbi:hypothetical protein Tco_0836485 [Tanacetum coccineum]